MKHQILYETDNLQLFSVKIPITVLTTDKGFFTDSEGHQIGKIIQVFKIINDDGSIIYEPQYETVLQYFPGDYFWTWTFNGKGYSRE